MVLDGGETASESCVDVLDATGYDSSGLTNKGSYISTTRNGFSKILLNNSRKYTQSFYFLFLSVNNTVDKICVIKQFCIYSR